MLIQRLWFKGWTDYQIWKEYRIPIRVIQKAKDEIEGRPLKSLRIELHAVELARLKHLLRLAIDCMDSIKDPKISFLIG